MPAIAVLGSGGVGGFLAAALAHAGAEVVLIAREDSAQLIADRGLVVRSAVLGDFTARPRVQSRLTDRVDFVLVATKAGGLRGALERVVAEPGLVVPLLNGLEHMVPLRSRFGDGVRAGVIRIESDRPLPGQIVQSSPSARVDLAGRAASALELAASLEQAGLEARTGDSEAQVLWSKLARLNPLALTTSASDRPLGFVRSDPRWRSALAGAVDETVAVARAEEAALDAATTLAELDGLHFELGSSMQRDIAHGREPELDAIAGAVLRAGARHGLPCPTVRWLADRVAARAGIAPPSA
ncbi:MAG: 2-dehydropantoate 2-reductase [Actinomycetota bacterium]|nr:2-dehydropantoate 2-reductase [Actinomycetota bacterium]